MKIYISELSSRVCAIDVEKPIRKVSDASEGTHFANVSPHLLFVIIARLRSILKHGVVVGVGRGEVGMEEKGVEVGEESTFQLSTRH